MSRWTKSKATILDRIKLNSKPPSPPNQAKTRHSPILDLGDLDLGGEGGGGGVQISHLFCPRL